MNSPNRCPTRTSVPGVTNASVKTPEKSSYSVASLTDNSSVSNIESNMDNSEA